MGEIKFHERIVNLNLGSSWGIFNLSLIGTGSTSVKRVGNVIKCYSLNIKGVIEQAVLTEETLRVRLLIFIDWQNQGVIPVVGDLFTDIVEFNRNMPRTQESYKFVRYTFLYDQYITLSSNGENIAGTGYILYRYAFNKYFKNLKHKIYYTGPNGLEAESSKGNIYLVVTDSNGDNAFRVKSVLKFTDV